MTIRNKIEDIKSNTIWFDKRFSLRFKIANTILHDDLRPLLGFVQHHVNEIKMYNRAHDESDDEIVSNMAVERYANRAIKRINEIWEL